MIRLTEEDLFAAYSLPSSTDFHVVLQNEQKIRPLQFERKAFVVAPFRKALDYPAFSIRPDTEHTNTPFSFFTKRRIFSRDISKSKYLIKVEKLRNQLSTYEDGKVILSRTKAIKRSYDDWAKVFTNLVKEHKEAFVFLFNTPEHGAWMGASPELLLSQKNEHFKTMAIAGTRNPDAFKGTWSDKDLQEHQIVVDFISRRLSKLKLEFVRSARSTIKAANVEHLCTAFDFTYQASVRKLLAALHPSPALLGWPEELAVSAVESIEENDRGYYCGYLGPVDADSKKLFVNLRSMRCASNKALLYAGGGILANSIGESEWLETEMKMKVLESVLKLNL